MRNVRIVGLPELVDRLQKIPDSVSREVSEELRVGAEGIAADAKASAPGDVGTLRQQIGVKKITDLTFEVISGAEYSPYVEFGTLLEVSIPPELQAYAAQFKGNGQGGNLSAKEAIFAWCERHGIEREAWFAIYMKLIRVGMKPHPFFFSAFNRQKPIILERIQKVLKDAI